MGNKETGGEGIGIKRFTEKEKYEERWKRGRDSPKVRKYNDKSGRDMNSEKGGGVRREEESGRKETKWNGTALHMYRIRWEVKDSTRGDERGW